MCVNATLAWQMYITGARDCSPDFTMREWTGGGRGWGWGCTRLLKQECHYVEYSAAKYLLATTAMQYYCNAWVFGDRDKCVTKCAF